MCCWWCEILELLFNLQQSLTENYAKNKKVKLSSIKYTQTSKGKMQLYQGCLMFGVSTGLKYSSMSGSNIQGAKCNRIHCFSKVWPSKSHSKTGNIIQVSIIWPILENLICLSLFWKLISNVLFHLNNGNNICLQISCWYYLRLESKDDYFQTRPDTL